MQIEDRVALSQDYCSKCYNCAQSVAASFKDLMGLDENTVLRISSSFGSGIGKLKEVCGVISGMAMAAGMLYGDIDPDDTDSKLAHYELVHSLADEFKQIHGSILCRELLEKADELGQPHKEFCSVLIGDAVRIMSRLVEKKDNEAV